VSQPATHATRILTEVSRGDASRLDELVPLLYDELRAVARAAFRHQRASHTLQPTALVHEAYLRLVDHAAAGFKGRAHFLATAAKVMRQILIDHHRRKSARKRGGGLARVTLAGEPLALGDRPIDVLALDEALERLSQLDERQGRIVDLRIFGGLEIDEIAAVLDYTPPPCSPRACGGSCEAPAGREVGINRRRWRCNHHWRRRFEPEGPTRSDPCLSPPNPCPL